MDIIDRLHIGLESGIIQHWRYTKELLKIKPEYLLTVAVADSLTNGYDSVCGLDTEIRLEMSTRSVAYALITEGVGLKRWFEINKDLNIGRKGRVDILATANRKSHLIELKGFDPNKPQISKELVRIQDYLALNSGDNSLLAGHVVFPSHRSYENLLTKYERELELGADGLTCEIVSRRHETQEDPEDGIPVYYTNSISISRVDA